MTHFVQRLSLATLLLLLAAAPTLAAFSETTISSNTSYSGSAIHVADLNNGSGDGQNDLVLYKYDAPFSGNNALVWYDNNSGAWTQNTIVSGWNHLIQIDTGDLDGDSNIDLVFSDLTSAQVAWYEYDGNNWTFTSLADFNEGAGEAIWGVEIIDLDEDGDNDVVVSWGDSDASGGGVFWLSNDDEATTYTLSHIDTNFDVDFEYFDVVDYDDDNDLDIFAVAPNQNHVYLFTNNGSESFTRSVATSSTISDPSDVVAVNLDSDSDLELVVATDGGQSLYVMDYNSGNGNWDPGTALDSRATGADGLKKIAVADLDEDGDLDIVAPWQNDTEINWYENTGSLSFTERDIEITNNFDYWFVDIADMNGDSYLDVVTNVYGDGGTPQAYYFQASAVVSTTLTDNQWQLIGVPVAITPTADGIPTTLFSDDISESYGEPNWVMSRYNMTTNSYDRFTGTGQSGGLPQLIAPGYGFWIIHTEGSNTTVDILHEVEATGTVSLAAAMPGYNSGESRNGLQMFANPFNQTYDVSNMTFGAGDVNWSTAATTYGLNGYIYTWNGSAYVNTLWNNPDDPNNGATLNPWEGFWLIRTDATDDSDIDVSFPAVGAGPRDGARQVVHEELTISVASLDGEYIDPSNRLGVRSNSSDGYDPYDAFDLGSMNGAYVRFSFPHSDWDTPGKFAADFRQSRWMDKPVWDAQVEMVNTPNTTYQMTFPDASELPENVDVLVMETRGEHARPVVIGTARTLDAHTFTSGPANYEKKTFRFEVVFGDRSLDAAEAAAGSLPTEFGIANVSPNPFNNSTTVQFALPRAGEVTVAVYNTLGQQVTTLARGEYAAGTHAVTWQADEMASGVYLLRAEHAGAAETRKITLVK